MAVINGGLEEEGKTVFFQLPLLLRVKMERREMENFVGAAG